MHIADGMVSAPVCLVGYGLTGLTTWLSLKQINRTAEPTQGVPKAALLTAAFFVASLIHIPVPPASVHLVLNGLMGVVLGYYAFPAVLIGLFFQAVMFGHGGLSTLGINAVIMGLPALVAAQIFRRGRWLLQRAPRWGLGCAAFGAGAIALALSVLLFSSIVVLSLPANLDATIERAAILTLGFAHIPLIFLEGIFTALLALFLDRVKPELLKD